MNNQITLELIGKLNQIIRTEILLINCGGCGIFAEYMSECLHKHGIPNQILLCDNTETPFETFKTNVNNAKNNGQFNPNYLSANHFMIKVGNLIFDGEDCYDNKDKIGFIVKGEYTLDEMSIANELGDWSDWYERNQNKKLKQIIEQFMFDYICKSETVSLSLH